MDPELYNAAALGRANSSANFLSDSGSNLAQITCGQGNTILHIAAKCGNLQAAERILSANPSLAYQANMKGDTPLHVAARLGRLEVAALLIENAGTPAAVLEAGTSPLHAVNVEKNTALHEAARNGRFGVVKMLVEKDRSLASFRNEAGESPVFLAVDRGYYATALCVLETFPHCSVFGRDGMTVMHAAVIRKNNPFVQKLVEICGSEILEIADDFGWMPLHYAAHLGNVNAVELILKTTSSLAYIKDNQGMSAIHISARSGQSRVVNRLVEARPDVCELLDNKGRTALHVAVDNRRKKVIKTLLNMMPFDDIINEQDLEGNTALHVAAIHANFQILQMLALENRVDKGIVNNMGMTAFDIFNESTVELTQMEKKFMLVLESDYIIQSLKGAVVSESRPTQSAAQRIGHEISEDITRETTAGNSAPEEELVSGNNSDRRTREHVQRKATSLTEYVKNMANVNLVIATLVVGITFAAALQMPGGYNDDGIANLKSKSAFKQFLVYNSLAFGCAAGSLLTYFTSTIFSRMFQFLRPQHSVTESVDIIVVMMFTALSVSFAVVAFMYATNAVLHQNTRTMFEITTHYMFWKLGLPATVANVSFYIPSIYFFYQLMPLIRLHFGTLFRRKRVNQY